MIDRIVNRLFSFAMYGTLLFIIVPTIFRAVFGVSWQKWMGI